MHLKKMEIIGFKSFADKTTIEFPSGISAIVGPNGCGKSNVVDALRWAMGEQSVKQLRGKAMEDVIFAGTNGRPPLNFAEVSLVLSNENGNSPEEFREFSEISVTRRLFRSGDSSYLINKQPCRLKDIHHLFLGSGMGAKSYSIIQQGNIGAITEAGPEERRIFLEEAAGITRYKSQRQEALQKIEATQANLLRLQDIITEVERQMGSVKRQVKKAEQYKIYQHRIMQLDVWLAIRHYDERFHQIQETESLLTELKDVDIQHTTRLRELDAAVEDIRLRRTQKNEEIEQKKQHKFEIQRRIDRLENDIVHLTKETQRLDQETAELQNLHHHLQEKHQNISNDAAALEEELRKLTDEIAATTSAVEQERLSSQAISQRQSELNRQWESVKTRLNDLINREAQYQHIRETAANTKESLKRRIKRMDEEEAVTAGQVKSLESAERKALEHLKSVQQELQEMILTIEGLKKQLEDNSSALAHQVKQTQLIETERNKIKARYSTLKKMADQFEWYKDGVKAILKRTSENPLFSGESFLGLVADIIEPEPEYQTAAEAVLGEALQYILVRDPQTAREAVSYLKSEDAGRCGFISVEKLKELERLAKSDESDRLLDHVRVKPGFEAVAEMLLGNVMMVNSADIPIESSEGITMATVDGDMVSPQGIIVGGSKDKLTGILAKKMELRELEKQTSELTQQLEIARQEQKSLEADTRAIEIELQQRLDLKNRIAKSEVEAEKAVYKVSEDLKHARRQLEMIRSEQDNLLGEESDIDSQIDKYHRLLNQSAQEIQEAQETAAYYADEIERVSAELEAHNRRMVDFRLHLTTLNAKRENTANTLRRLTEFQEDGVRRLEQLSKDIAQKIEKQLSSKQKLSEYGQAVAILYDVMKELEQDIGSREAEYQDIDSRLKENDLSAAGIRKEHAQIIEKIQILEMEQTRRRLECEHIETRIRERYVKPLEEFRQEVPEPPMETTLEQMEAELEEFRKKLSDMGDVNLGAITEYEQLKERFEFLDTQRSDLVKAIDDLHKVIRKINQVSQERFMEAFHQINEKLGEVFPKLFEGGSAKLTLTDPDKPLETGVEFMVHPPGKKLTRMSLLSGGEKALSAIAFIFSIFLIKPTSFCIMDEIDAALDEANVLRFNNLMKIIGEQSQIIMITHKKKSMEFADILFGVTMEQKGISKIVSVNFRRSEDSEDHRDVEKREPSSLTEA